MIKNKFKTLSNCSIAYKSLELKLLLCVKLFVTRSLGRRKYTLMNQCSELCTTSTVTTGGMVVISDVKKQSFNNVLE